MNSEEFILTPEEASTLAKELQGKIQPGEKPLGSEIEIKKLIAGLADKRGLLRRTFAEKLGSIGKRALPELRHVLLNSQDVIVRRAAAKTLKLVGEPEALPDLVNALITDKDPVVQGSSAGAIAIFGEAAVDYLIKVLEDPKSSSTQSGLAQWALAFIGAEGAKGLRKAAKSKSPVVRASAIAALGEQINSLNDNEARNLLKKAFNDSSDEVQIEAIRLMGFLKEESSDSNLLKSKLSNPNPNIRKQAALSLMSINAKDQINSLKSTLAVEVDTEVIDIIELTIKRLSS